MAKNNERIWGVLLHLGTNMWSDVRVENRVTEGFYKWGGEDGWALYSDEIRFDEALWREATGRMAAKGLNTVVIDLGEALAYPSHPELAVKGTWSVAKMKEELKRLRGMGLTPVPKLNFSTGHDPWLKEYERMVSAPDYYRVCADLIRDVVEIFDGPELFLEDPAGDAQQPGIERLRLAQLLERQEGPHERFLRGLLRFQVIPQPAGQIREQRPLIALHQQPEVL
ncbi:MAG TPA: hypothetical protein PKI32_10120, partial [Opitutales bacterium]|nr:hypothetical protein [Opitutales bacterium]